jgi:hypothetical protein
MANELLYGDQIHLQNGYMGFQAGGFLDTYNNLPSPMLHCVATANSPTRAAGSGTWEVLSASGQAKGQPVLSGDLIHVHNLYSSDGGYLDTYDNVGSIQGSVGGMYVVGTSQAPDRDDLGTGRWRIFGQTSSPYDRRVRIGDVVHFWNLYQGSGGFLETNQNNDNPGLMLDVCTNAYYNRENVQVADWKILKA